MRTTGNIFTRHPASVGESYFQHLRFAAGFAALLFAAAFAAMLHAIAPFLFEKTASSIVKRLNAQINGRGA